MNQAKFLYIINKIQPVKVVDNGNGKIIVTLRDDVQITHNYKKNNRMEIIFIDTQKRYVISNQNQLESILRIHLGYKNFNEPAIIYCDNHLEKA